MAKRLIPYVNRFNGDVKVVTKSGAKKLSEDYTPVKFVQNQEGEAVMRFELEGATVDISENKTEAVEDGNRSTK